MHMPELRPIDNQPHLRMAVHGCHHPGYSWALVDTGACFTMISEKVAEAHGIKIHPYTGKFQQADPNSSGELIGRCSFSL